ncbi:hypothetical protein [Marinicrinis lubricantis]|uniref:DUF6199 domain-containing protein n=1 Tax=Marinicrinis lubricantis TaxID=2086470 RepID=A0ABW1IPP1_9BACL
MQEDRIILACMFFVIFVIPGIVGIIKPELTYRAQATNTLNKKPSKSAIKRFRMGSYVMLIVGVLLITAALHGGFKGT